MRRFDRVVRGACASHLGRPSSRRCYGGASPFTRRWVAVIACGLPAGAAGVLADDHAEAQFQAAGKADPVRIVRPMRIHGNRRKSFAGKADGVFGRDTMRLCVAQ